MLVVRERVVPTARAVSRWLKYADRQPLGHDESHVRHVRGQRIITGQPPASSGANSDLEMQQFQMPSQGWTTIDASVEPRSSLAKAGRPPPASPESKAGSRPTRLSIARHHSHRQPPTTTLSSITTHRCAMWDDRHVGPQSAIPHPRALACTLSWQKHSPPSSSCRGPTASAAHARILHARSVPPRRSPCNNPPFAHLCSAASRHAKTLSVTRDTPAAAL